MGGSNSQALKDYKKYAMEEAQPDRGEYMSQETADAYARFDRPNQQPLQSLDVTKGGKLEFQPMQPVKVQSTNPEVVSQAIAGAVSGIGTQALSQAAKMINPNYSRDVSAPAVDSAK